MPQVFTRINKVISVKQVFVWISNGFWENGGYLSGFQMVGLPDFSSHSKSRPFATKPLFDHLISRLVGISGSHCSSFSVEIEINLFVPLLNRSPASSCSPPRWRQNSWQRNWIERRFWVSYIVLFYLTSYQKNISLTFVYFYLNNQSSIVK